ncbi:hypothetical protein KM043_013026 [Ampulex compressa]|nr:hypothetical protein KM043_013026 [Ampulex compressa]
MQNQDTLIEISLRVKQHSEASGELVSDERRRAGRGEGRKKTRRQSNCGREPANSFPADEDLDISRQPCLSVRNGSIEILQKGEGRLILLARRVPPPDK